MQLRELEEVVSLLVEIGSKIFLYLIFFFYIYLMSGNIY